MKRKIGIWLLRSCDKIVVKVIKTAEKSMSNHYIRGDLSNLHQWYRIWKKAKRSQDYIRYILKEIEES